MYIYVQIMAVGQQMILDMYVVFIFKIYVIQPIVQVVPQPGQRMVWWSDPLLY